MEPPPEDVYPLKDFCLHKILVQNIRKIGITKEICKRKKKQKKTKQTKSQEKARDYRLMESNSKRSMNEFGQIQHS